MQNLLSVPIPAAKLKEAIDFFEQGAAILRPYLHSLTPEERSTMLKMADKTVAFVNKIRDYAANNPSFVPDFIDMAEFHADTDALAGLSPVHMMLAALALDTDSTMMLAGSDAYAAALVIYNNIKFLAKNKRPAAQAAYDDLRQRFPQTGRPSKPLTPSAA